MTAMSLILEPHRGQSNGLISYTFAISLAHAERQVACDTVVGSVPSACGDIGSTWDRRHPWGATRETCGKRCRRALHREEYNP